MIEINEELLSEVSPAFNKAIDLLLKEASGKLGEVKELIDEAKRLSKLIDGGSLDHSINQIVLEDNSELIEDLFDISRIKKTIQRPHGLTDPSPTVEIVALKAPREGLGAGVPLYLNDSDDSDEHEHINLVTQAPLDRNIRPKKSKGNKTPSKTSGVYNKGRKRKYRGIKTKVEYRGVTFVKANAKHRRYRARVMIKGTEYEIGFYSGALEAAYAYDEFKYKRTNSLKGLNFPERIEMRLKKKKLNG